MKHATTATDHSPRRRWHLWFRAGALAGVLSLALVMLAADSAGPQISLNSPASFPVDI